MADETHTLNDLEFEILALVVDGETPYAIVFPEVRRDIQPGLEPAEFDRIVGSMLERDLVRLRVRDGGGVNPRDVTAADHETIVREYMDGERDPDKVRQIFDRPDIWIDVTELGRTLAAVDRS